MLSAPTIELTYWSDTNQSQQEMKCGVVGNPAYDVFHVQGSAGDGLEADYNMENESTKVQNYRHVGGMASDGVMINCTMILKCNYSTAKMMLSYMYC